MIYAELAGGLGNQMFIYAFARALGLRCNEPVTLLDRQDWKRRHAQLPFRHCLRTRNRSRNAIRRQQL